MPMTADRTADAKAAEPAVAPVALPVTRSIVTSRDFSTDRLRLLELTPEVEKAIVAGEKVFIVGGGSQRAVLCTADKSFYLAKEDTSNLRMLTTHTQWKSDQSKAATEIVMEGAAAFHYVLQPKVPDISHLRTLLLESPYTKRNEAAAAPNAKRQRNHQLYTTSRLTAVLQTSEQEVFELLERIHAFNDAGAWRLLDPAYQVAVFGEMLDAIVQNDWTLQGDGIALSQILLSVDEPSVVVRQCCRVYGTILRNEAGEEACVFDKHKIATFYAKQLFQETPPLDPSNRAGIPDGWTLEPFMDKWRLRVPDGVTVSEGLLRGLALVKKVRAKPPQLVYFPEEELPMDPKQRFDQLFQVQEKWTIPELEPYISPLVRPGVTQASLLLKYSRSSRQGNSTERLYSKR